MGSPAPLAGVKGLYDTIAPLVGLSSTIAAAARGGSEAICVVLMVTSRAGRLDHVKY